MLLGAYLSCGARCLLSARVLSAAVVVGLAVAFSFVVNAYRDVAADSLNEPRRPIPSGRVSRRVAGKFAMALAGVALGVAATLGPLMALFALGTVLLSALYSYRLKSTVLIGNAVIGTLNASIVVYGALAAGAVTPAAWVVGLLVFLGTVAQEILYTVRDQAGDARAGTLTIATRYGEEIAVRFFQLSALLFVGAATLVWLLGLASLQYVYALVPCTMLPMVGIVLLLGRQVTAARVRFALRVINAVWVTSLIPILFFR
jgi:4-hydroxybenzoate polyprenyltransferase